MANQFFGKKTPNLTLFLGKGSAEASAEASVKVAEASVSAESHFRPIRSFTNDFSRLERSFFGHKHFLMDRFARFNVSISLSLFCLSKDLEKITHLWSEKVS